MIKNIYYVARTLRLQSTSTYKWTNYKHTTRLGVSHPTNWTRKFKNRIYLLCFHAHKIIISFVQSSRPVRLSYYIHVIHLQNHTRLSVSNQNRKPQVSLQIKPHTFYYRYSFHALQLSTTTTKFCQSQTPKLLDRTPQPWHQKRRGNTNVL